MFNIKALAMATAVSAGVVFAMPVTSQAMPVTSPVKIQTAGDSNIVNVNHKKKSKNWWAWHCAHSNDWRCYNNKRQRYTYRYRSYDYDEPYYGYYRPYRPYRPGIYLNID